MEAAAGRRPYRMVARAEAAAATGERILDAFVELFWEELPERITLDAVAERAGVTVQTVIRRFGGKEGLFDAALEREVGRVAGQRDLAEPGDVEGAVAILVEHYEQMGDRMARLLAEEDRSPAVKRVLDSGREYHRKWCRAVFAPFLDGLGGVTRSRRFAQLVVICDLQTWRLLRRDLRLSRTQTERAVVEMLAPFTNTGA